MRLFIKTNSKGNYDIQIKAKQDTGKTAWIFTHFLCQIARFGTLDLKIKGEEQNSVLLAKSIGENIGKAIKDKLRRERRARLFLWPFEQSLCIAFIDPFPKKGFYADAEIDTNNRNEQNTLKSFCKEFAKAAEIGVVLYAIDSGKFRREGKGMMYNTHHQFEGLGKSLGRVLRELTERTTAKPGLILEGKDERVSLETQIKIHWGFHKKNAGTSEISIKAERDPNQNMKILKEGLTEFAKASNSLLVLEASGDDEHHIYEDIAIVLGNLLSKMMGARKGIMRTAWAIRSIGNSIVIIALDLGRGYCHIETDFKDISLQSMVHHFFETFSRFAKMDIVVFAVKNNHPVVPYVRLLAKKTVDSYGMLSKKRAQLGDYALANVLFQAFGTAFRDATAGDPKRRKEIPSTKGLFD